MIGNKNIIQKIDIERERIAKDLHDSSLQNIVHLIHKVDIANIYLEKGEKESVAIQLNEINDGLKEIVDNIRLVIYDLKPMSFEDVGFDSSIEQYIKKVSDNTDIHFEVKIDKISLENEKASSLYRVIQECVNNVLKHSKAEKCLVSIVEIDNCVIVNILDNGIGFDVNQGKQDNHFGLQFAFDRIESMNGYFEIKSEIGKGTEYIIKINK